MKDRLWILNKLVRVVGKTLVGLSPPALSNTHAPLKESDSLTHTHAPPNILVRVVGKTLVGLSPPALSNTHAPLKESDSLTLSLSLSLSLTHTHTHTHN